MKEHIIPYLIHDQQWWTGLSFTNIGNQSTIIRFDSFGSNGRQLDSQIINISPRGQVIQTWGKSAKGWVRAISNDNVFISQFYGYGDTCLSGNVERRDLIVGNIVQSNQQLVTIDNTPFLSFVGQPECCYLCSEFYQCIDLCAMIIGIKFPDRPAPKFEVGSGCPETGNCPGHPSGSHCGGTQVDGNYFTLGDSNNTQYGPGPIIQIWTNGNLNEMFDAERTMEFVILLKKILPKAIIMMHSKIKAALMTAAWHKYGDVGRAIVSAAIQEEDTPEYRHETHFHIDYDRGTGDNSMIDWGAIL